MLNNCIFQGRFAADPEMRTTQSGLTVASFRMAVDRDNVGQDGRRATDWLNFVAWRKTAEFVCQYFRKGSTALVECQCQTRSYEDRNGQKRTATEFVVQKIHFCGPKTEQRVDDGGEAPPPGYQQSYQQPSYQNQQPQQMASPPRTSGSNWQQSAPAGSSPATRRATLTISRSSMTATTCVLRGLIMATGKRYYWIKLKDSFMSSDMIDYLMGQPDGANYVVLYQMLCLKTINTGGDWLFKSGI